MTTPTESWAPLDTARRALAPDLARGLMLLVIALAHAPLFVAAIDHGPAIANRATEFFHILFVNNHARSMFAFLFGYALVQLIHGQARRVSDWAPVRKLLRRRGWWMVLIGFVHMTVLTPLDIIAAYGITAVLLVGLLRAKDSTLLWIAGLTLVPATVGGPSLAIGAAMSSGVSTYSAASLAASTQSAWQLFLDRLQMWPVVLVAGVIAVVPAVMCGIWAARRGMLDEPARHRTTLVRVAVGSTILSLAGSVPAALIQTDLWAHPHGAALWGAALAQPLTGYIGGIGITAIVGLASLAAARHRGPLTTAVQALGQRSLSLYLFQSLVFAILFYPYGFRLDDNLGLAGATGVAIATWLVSLLIAELMRRIGHRGPAELLLRRLTYGTTRRRRSVAHSEVNGGDVIRARSDTGERASPRDQTSDT